MKIKERPPFIRRLCFINMFSLVNNLKFVNINQDYLKYLYSFCSEVYYKPYGYEAKPYIGLLINSNGTEYVIPMSSAKEKHKFWKNTDTDRFLIFENCTAARLGYNDIYVNNADGTVKHIMAVIDLKKMIPVKAGLYSQVNINPSPEDTIENKKYKILLNIEYSFCLKIIDSIIVKAGRIYDKQMRTGKIIKFCCDFRLLEEKCREYPAE